MEVATGFMLGRYVQPNSIHNSKDQMKKNDYEFRKTIAIAYILGSLALSSIFLFNTKRNINDVNKSIGQITSKQVVKEKYKGNNYRYTFVFTISSLEQKLGIFLGSGKDAIKKGQYYIDLFSLGDQITVYYENNFITRKENLTRLIRKIEYRGDTILERDMSRGWIFGIVLLIPIPIFLFLLIWLKRKYKKDDILHSNSLAAHNSK